MSSNDEYFLLRREGDRLLITLQQEILTSHDEVRTLFRKLGELAAMTPKPDFVLILLHVTHVASVFLGNLVKLVNQIEDKNGKIVLTHVNEQIVEVLRLTRIDDHIIIEDA